MAKQHNQLSRGQWSDAIKRALGQTKDDTGVERFGETLTPVMDQWARREWSWLRSENPWSDLKFQGAVAGEFSGAAVSIPAGSGLLLVVTRIQARSGAATAVSVGITPRAAVAATFAQGQNALSVDSRFTRSALASTDRTAVETWSGTDPAGFIGGFDEIFPATGAYADAGSCPLIIKPGMAAFAICGTVLTAMGAIFHGLVRAALPGELL